MRVAVVRLEVTGNYCGGDVRQWLPDYFTSRICEAGWQVNGETVEVLERNNIDDVIREQDFGRSGRVDPATAAPVGKIHGATHLIQLTARVSTEDVVAGLGGSWGGWNLEGGRVAKASVVLNGRIVNAATGAIVAVGITGKSKSRLTDA
ncbi:MAG: curli production assembly/transport component CsgG, partial [Candidatus Berkelbacteria bacterium Licking1014_2]